MRRRTEALRHRRTTHGVSSRPNTSVPRCLGASVLSLFVLFSTSIARAQDTTRTEPGVRVGITYTPGVRPSLAVLAAPGVDSARAILLPIPFP